MDSFYDQPRNVPVPLSADQILPKQLVPDVSIIIPNYNNQKQKIVPVAKDQKSYNVWKTQKQNALQKTSTLKCNKENISLPDNEVNSSILKSTCRKHVRFNSPQIQRQALNISSKGNMTSDSFNKSNKSETKPFEQIYMANIPNRHLDLSIIEPCSYNHKIPIMNDKDKGKCSAVIDNIIPTNKINNPDLVINAYQHKQPQLEVPPRRDQYIQNHTDNIQINNNIQRMNDPCNFYNYEKFKSLRVQGEPTYTLSKNDNKNNESDEPTVKDLLKVVQQQNEQILLLQKQVSLLLENRSNQKQIEPPPVKQEDEIPIKEYINNMQTGKPQHNQQHASKGALSKFAIDVMTSFEVSIRPPTNYPLNKFIREVRNEPKIQEITEPDVNAFDREKVNCDNILDDIKQQTKMDSDAKQNVDLSLTLNEPLKVVERCPSPENSIHVDMQDYSSDDDDSSSSNDIGWTIYNNVMGQVNNILQKADADMKEFTSTTNTNTMRDRTLKKVREATLRHLKSIGVNLPIIEESGISQELNKTVNGSEYTPTEVSFAVKQLLMKYLPDEQLTKVTQQTKPENIVQKDSNVNIQNLIKRRPEFSFATVQYMKKYNLLTSDSAHPEPVKQNKNIEIPKILDVTALKQQPKLL